jgi:hypothetical protein
MLVFDILVTACAVCAKTLDWYCAGDASFSLTQEDGVVSFHSLNGSDLLDGSSGFVDLGTSMPPSSSQVQLGPEAVTTLQCKLSQTGCFASLQGKVASFLWCGDC